MIRRSFGICCGSVLVTGCAFFALPNGLQRAQLTAPWPGQTKAHLPASRGSPDLGGPGYTYAAQFWTGINLYPTNNQRDQAPLCQIIAGDERPEGLATDSSGTLYVAGTYGKRDGIATFGLNCGALGATFAENIGNPQDLVVDGSTLYLTTINDDPKPASILIFNAEGSQLPVNQLTDPRVAKGIGVATNSHHDLFWSTTNISTAAAQVIEFRGGKMPGILLNEGTTSASFPGGVLTDKSDNLRAAEVHKADRQDRA